MNYQFEADKRLSPEDLEVLVRSHSLNPNVQHFLDYLDLYQKEAPTRIPIKTIDRIELLKVDELICADVDGTSLVLETTKGQLIVTERLYRFQERLNNPDFVQVSKQAIININHLEYLEDSISGAMTAFLTNHIKTSVSRKYLKSLASRLGL